MHILPIAFFSFGCATASSLLGANIGSKALQRYPTAPCAIRQIHDISIASSNLTFQPPTLRARPGDILQFGVDLPDVAMLEIVSSQDAYSTLAVENSLYTVTDRSPHTFVCSRFATTAIVRASLVLNRETRTASKMSITTTRATAVSVSARDKSSSLMVLKPMWPTTCPATCAVSCAPPKPTGISSLAPVSTSQNATLPSWTPSMPASSGTASLYPLMHSLGSIALMLLPTLVW